jgi:hemerythrin-like domain-containing protein
MVLIHNILIRGMNAIHRQALNVATKGTAKDKLDFASYGYQWSVTVHSHHQLEEEAIFPRIAKDTGVENIMATNIEEHEAFEAGLDTYSKYMKEVKDGVSELDGQKLIGIIDEMMPVLHQHLINEVDTLLSLKQYEEKCDLEGIFRDEVGKAMKIAMGSSMYRVSLSPATEARKVRLKLTSSFAERPSTTRVQLPRQGFRRRCVDGLPAYAVDRGARDSMDLLQDTSRLVEVRAL